MFRGVNAINLDTKGRVALPTRYRDLVQMLCKGQMIVTIDTEEQCLLLYPLDEWETIEKKIEALPSFNRAARRIQRLLIGHAAELELDSQGRLLIPGKLREYAQLDKKVVLIGQGKKFEVWSELLWEERRQQWLSEGAAETEDALPADLLTLSL